MIPIVNGFLHSTDPDENLSIKELILSHGYDLQEHRIVTHDGYVLMLHRAVPFDYDRTTYNIFRKPVIIFHGVITDTAYFYFNSPLENTTHTSCSDNFGFCLLKQGRYDLWIPNARGNRYSRGHLRYSDHDSRYWSFSWDHIAMGDIPAFIDYIRQETNHKTVGYIGYSQGAGTLFAFLSMRPEYTNVIQPFICWAPGVILKGAKTIIAKPLVASIPWLTKNPGQFLLSNELINPLLQYFGCRPGLRSIMCNLVFQAIFGPSQSLNSTRIATYSHYVPSSISNWQAAHYADIGSSGRFSRFDYGHPMTNLAVYGQPIPPTWPIHRIPTKMKILIIYGATDWFIDKTNAQKLIRMLRNLGHYVQGAMISNWNHVDFLMGYQTGKLVFDRTVKFLDLYAWDDIDWTQLIP